MQPIIRSSMLPLHCLIDRYSPAVLDANAQIFISICANSTIDDLEKVNAFAEALNESPYQHVFERLLRCDPLMFLSLFGWIDTLESKTKLTNWCFESLGANAIDTIYRCLATCINSSLSPEQKITMINPFLSSFPIEIEAKVADYFFKSSLKDSALIIFHITDQEKLKDWLCDYLEYFDQMDRLGEAILEIIKLTLPLTTKRSPLVSTLLTMSTETIRIDDWLIEHIDEIGSKENIQILLNIDVREQGRYLSHLYQCNTTDSLVELLSQLIYWDEDLNRRVQWTEKMIGNFHESYFEELCKALVEQDNVDDEDNDAIVYFLYALDNKRIDDFMNLPVELKNSILNRAMPKDKASFDQLLSFISIENLNRFLYKCELPIASQTPIAATLGIFGNWATFEEVIGYVENAIRENALADFMQTFTGDLYCIPPFLIALAMNHFSFRQTLIHAILYLKPDQIKALAFALTDEILVPSLEKITEIPISIDQYEIILDAIQGDFLEKYIRQKFAVLQRECEQINARFEQIKACLNDLAHGDHSRLESSINEASKLHFQLVKILSPFHRRLVDLSKQISPILSIPFQKLWDECREKLYCINDETIGYKKRLLDFKPPITQEEETFHWKSNVSLILSSQFQGIEFFEGVGFRTDRDFTLIGVDFEREGFETILKNYLEQSEKLLKIWKKFKKKHITSLSDLETFGLIEEYKDFFSLETIASKMGIELWNQ